MTIKRCELEAGQILHALLSVGQNAVIEAISLIDRRQTHKAMKAHETATGALVVCACFILPESFSKHVLQIGLVLLVLIWQHLDKSPYSTNILHVPCSSLILEDTQ